MLTRTLIALVFLISAHGFGQKTQQERPDPGFTEAVFEDETIKKLLELNDSDGIRIYNVMWDDVVRAAAVAVDDPSENGADVQKGFLYRPYRLTMGLSASKILVDKRNIAKTRNASEALDLITDKHHYSVNFPKNGVNALLSADGCNALRVSPRTSDGELSMLLEAVKFSNGTVTDLGSGEGYDLIGTAPCPPICGSKYNYVYRP